MRRVAILVVACAVLVAGVAVAVRDEQDKQRSGPGALVEMGGKTVRAEVADDVASLQLGLGGRPGLGADEGMLFLLPDDSTSFWMKGMRFPIDIIWIKDGRVVDVTANVPPPRDASSPLPTYSPRRPANRALEVNAGWAARHAIERGDTVRVRRQGGYR